MMKTYQKEWTTNLPITIDEAWSFFSRPENLELITPEYMNFNILSKSNYTEIYEGMIIRYRVSPLMKLPMHWTTEITHCKPGHYFVDEQRKGPFSMWHHEHHFLQKEHSLEMRDILTYALPFGIIGRLANQMVVSKQIDSIFAFREFVLKNKFGS